MDIYTKEKRSEIMRKIKSKDTGPEKKVRSLLHSLGYRFRLHRKDLPGKPDIVLPKYKTVIFVHGCFWHIHEGCRSARTPKSKLDYWVEKLNNNKARDLRNRQELLELGWKVYTVWECETKSKSKLAEVIFAICNDFSETSKNIARVDPTNMYRVASMFSGCGGMDLGFLGGFNFLGKYYDKHNFSIVWANDINEYACKTYKLNIGDHITCGDVWKHLNSMPSGIDVLIGGFPCQDISVNGKMVGIKGKRSSLYKAMVDAIAITHPKVFVAENVKGLLLKCHADSLQKVISDFTKLGYDVTFSLYDASDYGVPQTRERVFIVGTMPEIKKFIPPKPTHGKMTCITAEQALKDLENKGEDESINHVWSKANKSSDQGNRKLIADRPGYTIRAECHGNIQFHYRLNRRISMREAARLQSFPDSYIFASKLRETERQIGNAVPPVLSWHIANAILACLS